ncbi:hypothetical protein Tco_0883719 [Tanacetum coccineum]
MEIFATQLELESSTLLDLVPLRSDAISEACGRLTSLKGKEVWNRLRSGKARFLDRNGNLYVESSVLLGRKKGG